MYIDTNRYKYRYFVAINLHTMFAKKCQIHLDKYYLSIQSITPRNCNACSRKVLLEITEITQKSPFLLLMEEIPASVEFGRQFIPLSTRVLAPSQVVIQPVFFQPSTGIHLSRCSTDSLRAPVPLRIGQLQQLISGNGKGC